MGNCTVSSSSWGLDSGGVVAAWIAADAAANLIAFDGEGGGIANGPLPCATARGGATGITWGCIAAAGAGGAAGRALDVVACKHSTGDGDANGAHTTSTAASAAAMAACACCEEAPIMAASAAAIAASAWANAGSISGTTVGSTAGGDGECPLSARCLRFSAARAWATPGSSPKARQATGLGG